VAKNLKKMKLTTILIFTALFFANQTIAQTKDMPRLFKINDNFYRGGQPTENGLAELKKLGIKTIINLRTTGKDVSDEETAAKRNGLNFINVPLNNWFKPKNSEVENVLKLINDANNQPVFLHCKRGSDRTGTIVAAYRIRFENWTDEQAVEEAKTFGFGWWQVWMKDYIEDYYRDFKAEKH
jgi:tyrosine-protein phosphatase SIW14